MNPASRSAVCFSSLSLNCPCVSMGEEGGLGGWGPWEKKGRLAVHFNHCSGAWAGSEGRDEGEEGVRCAKQDQTGLCTHTS